jgi:hypothetical protein
MNGKTRIFWMLTGLAIAGAVSVAHAAKPLTPQERKAKAQELTQNHRTFQQPRTIAQTNAAARRLPDGTTTAPLATELWNHLSVQRDATGQLKIQESDGAIAPNTATEGSDHE